MTLSFLLFSNLGRICPSHHTSPGLYFQSFKLCIDSSQKSFSNSTKGVLFEDFIPSETVSIEYFKLRKQQF